MANWETVRGSIAAFTPSSSKAPEQWSPADKLAAMTQAVRLSYPTWAPSAASMAWVGSYRQDVSICRGWEKRGLPEPSQRGGVTGCPAPCCQTIALDRSRSSVLIRLRHGRPRKVAGGEGETPACCRASHRLPSKLSLRSQLLLSFSPILVNVRITLKTTGSTPYPAQG